MRIARFAICVVGVLLGFPQVAASEIRTVIGHRTNDEASRGFRFENLPPPSLRDLAASASFKLLEGRIDSNSRGLEALSDGQLPTDEDQPRANFFFAPGTDGGRILIDFGKPIEIKQVNTYSWHPDTRGPQVYRLFAADGANPQFSPEPRRPLEPDKCGWRLLAAVDTRPKERAPGGQYGVSIFDTAENLGRFRYLLFDISRTEDRDPFGNTFYSEIDVIDPKAPETAVPEPAALHTQAAEEVIESGGYQIRLDTSDTPDLTEWVHREVGPMAKEWYPKLTRLLASEGFEPPRRVTIVFDSNMRGVAATSGSRVRCAGSWFRQNLKGEALGAVFHELVHVVQQYGRSRPVAEGATRPPGWLVEGIADYVRWFLFEPQSRGAEITRRNLSRARYDGNYRISANFLNWVTRTYDPDLVPHLNVAIRQGNYREDLWRERTGRSLSDLGAEWRAAMEKQVAASDAAPRQSP